MGPLSFFSTFNCGIERFCPCVLLSIILLNLEKKLWSGYCIYLFFLYLHLCFSSCVSILISSNYYVSGCFCSFIITFYLWLHKLSNFCLSCKTKSDVSWHLITGFPMIIGARTTLNFWLWKNLSLLAIIFLNWWPLGFVSRNKWLIYG